MKSSERHRPSLRVIPAHQRLDGLDPTAFEVDDRLVLEDELASLERALQVGFQLESLHHLGMEALLEEVIPALRLALGLVHGQVRVAEELPASCRPSASAMPRLAVIAPLALQEERRGDSLTARMKRVDVLIVGAGPAGSTAAYRLRREGASVLLVDRATFPRDKPCGGGLTMRAVRQLPFSVEPVVEDRATRFTFGLDFKHHFERTTDEPLVLLTQRSRLDHFLAERAAEAGADFRDGVTVELISDAVEARVSGEKIAANALICADGANGHTARAAGLADDRDYGVALEGNVPHAAIDPARFRGRLFLELGVLPGGYGWVFP